MSLHELASIALNISRLGQKCLLLILVGTKGPIFHEVLVYTNTHITNQ